MSCEKRPQLWNASSVGSGAFKFQDGTVVDGSKESCIKYVQEKYGELGFAGGTPLFNQTRWSCWRGCPNASCMSTDADGNQIQNCNPRPLLTAIELYYQVLKDATATCLQKSDAYKKAVEENGGDPSMIGFNSDCPNPYAPAVVPDPTGQGNPGVFDPSSSNGDPNKPLDAPPIDAGVPYIPPPPATYRNFDPIASDTAPASTELPYSRITLTDEEIDQFPKVNDYGTMREDTLAQLCRVQPTYCDVNTEHLNDCEKYIKDFSWCCIPTQAEFDLLDDSSQCLLAENYNTLYGRPELIKQWRKLAPSITITRDAPPVDVPVYQNTPKERRRQTCNAQVGGDGLPCVYSGECLGTCKCGDAPTGEPYPSAPPPPPDWFKADNMTIVLVAGGLMVAGIVGYGIFKVVSPTGRAMAMAQGNFGTSTSSVGIGGFRLVPT